MGMPSKRKPNLHRNQQGFASIVIALILIVVLALLTVGFAQLARREQQSALDKQLASQAYYAAESGINDMQQLIQKVLATPAGIPGILPSLDSLTPPSAGLGGNEDPTACLGGQGFPGIPSGNINSATGVSYSCVLLNLTPPSMVWSGVSPDSDRAVTFSTTGNLNSLTVYWGSNDSSSTFKGSIPANSEFTPVTSWNGAPAVLEVSITPLPPATILNPNPLNRASLISNTFNVFLYPSTSGSNVTYATGTQGQVIGGQCNVANPNYPCSVTINGINGSAGEQYVVHILDYYDESNISVGNAANNLNQPLNFVDGQAQIDVTGVARTVLKRIQVHAPIKETAPIPPYAIQGQNVCKRFSAYPGTVTPDTLSPSCSLN